MLIEDFGTRLFSHSLKPMFPRSSLSTSNSWSERFSREIGLFFTARIEFHESASNPFSLKIKIDPASVDTGVTKRDDHLRSVDVFDIKQYQSINFISKKVVPTENGKYQVEGTLTMHGVSKDISIDLEGLGIEVKDPWGNLRKGAQGTADINRKDFGIVYNSVLESGNLLIGETADVSVDLQFIKK